MRDYDDGTLSFQQCEGPVGVPIEVLREEHIDLVDEERALGGGSPPACATFGASSPN